jgi:autotransporter-associated beta strand protein
MKIPFAPIALAACLFGTNPANAFLAGPYTVDAYTLHLWHLDETAVPCIDSVSSGGNNLVDLATGATLGNASYSGFGSALNTAAGGTGKGDLLAASPTAGNVTITLADPTTGAFTFEALVQIQFDPTVSSTSAYEIMAGESGANANRIFQWRIVPKGFTLVSGTTAAGPYMTFENIRAISGNQATIYAAIPTTGPDAIVSNGWYHVAVTYNGLPSTPNNLIFYWTAMNSANTSDDPLTISSAVTQLTGLNPKSSVTTTFMLGNQGRSLNGNFLGAIDEVRISRIARGPSGMMFALPSVTVTPLNNQFATVGSTVTLTSLATGGLPINYQWQFNGVTITSATATNISGYATNSLVISNITYAEAGAYTLIAANATSTNSASAYINVGAPVSGLFNTGVTATGALLPGGSIDPNWQLIQSADPTYTGPNAIVDSTIPATYISDGPNSQWIAPGDNVGVAGGNYEYQTTFVLDSQNLTNMQLILNWAADNVCVDALLNGVDLGITNDNGYTAFAPTVITNNFLAGSNVLVCVISNAPGSGPNLSAFRAELSALSAPLAPTAVQILYPPSNVAAYQYQNTSFAVTAYGSSPLSYQWYFGTNLLSGQTSRVLTLTDLAPSQAGTYTVVIANNVSTNSANATLAITAPDTLEWQGLLTADWDLATANWYDMTTLTDVSFSQNANVLFNDTGSAQPVINLDVPVTPNSMVVSADNNYTLFGNGGYLTGNFNLLLNGPGTLILDAPNTYAGATVIQGGTLQVGNNDANGSLGSSAVSNNAALTFTRIDTVTVPNQISGSGSVTMAGTGNLILTGNNLGFTGSTAVTGGGILTPRSVNALGTGAAGATVLDGSQIYIDENLNFPTLPLLLGGTGNGGAGALRKGGSGATYLGGPVTLLDYAGIALDGSSSLFLTNPAAITSTNANLAIQCASSAVCTIDGAVNLGSGSFTEYGTGTVVLASLSNIWTGGTTINTGGILQVGDGSTNASIGNGAISDGGTLTFLTSNNLVLTEAVSGGGVFNQSGAGRLVLSGNPLSAFSGAIHINGNGQLQLANGDSLANGTLAIGAAQADTNRLELTGNNTVSIPITIFPRAAAGTLTSTTPTTNYADIINLRGTNTVSPTSPVTIASGGNLFALECDSGYFIFNGGLTSAGVGRNFALEGPGSGEVDGPITQGTGFSVNVYVLGTGLWTLTGQSSYTGATIVSNGTLVVNGSIASSPVTAYGGTLGGIGTLTGPVVVAAGAKLAPTLAAGPAVPIGTLTVNNALTLQPGSFTSMQINKAMSTNDQITGLTSVSFAGTLLITNLGGTLAAGDAFQLFSAASYGGKFTGITPASPGPGLRWNLGGLSVDGLLRITSTNLARPTITTTALTGGNLALSGTGGTVGDTYALLTSTNIGAPLSTWTQVTNGVFDGSGNFAINASVATNVSQSFFVVASQ